MDPILLVLAPIWGGLTIGVAYVAIRAAYAGWRTMKG
jgi:hypothetical protein